MHALAFFKNAIKFPTYKSLESLSNFSFRAAAA